MQKTALVKFLTALLAAALLLTACSSPSSSDPGSGTASDSGSGSSSGSGTREEVELVWYVPVTTVGTGQEDMIEAANAYTKEKLNTTVDFHIYPQADYNSAVSTIVSSGTYMDMVFTGAALVNFNDFVARNAFAPITDYIDQYLPQTKAQLTQEAWEAFTYQGEIYAIPPMKDMADNMCFLLNQDMMDDLDLTFPETYNTYHDVYPFIYEAQEKRDAKYPEKAGNPIMGGLTTRFINWYNIESLLGGDTAIVTANIPGLTGVEGMGDGETAYCPFYTDEYREIMKIKRQMVVDGVAPFDSENFDPDKVLWQNGDLLGTTSRGYLFVEPDMYAPYFTTTLERSDVSIMYTSYIQSGGQAISASSENIERALEYLELVNNDTYLATILRFGAEGDYWTDEDNDGILEWGPLNEDSGSRGWYNWYGWQYGSIITSKYPEGYPADFGQMVKDLNSNANRESNIGFTVNTENIVNEIAACNNVVAEYNSTLDKGQSDDVDGIVDDFVAKLKDNGCDKIIEEVQKQLTEWRASQGMPTK